ncbi:EfeM/EfeO family lipoprotein [Vitiosangium sp. GDMCC 1.1324]|uniref:EfeM/EfeO family lipoprotein n=1 Tax=Vitiosangium sp. (strain GDMCC 1.1324) TaxID=2138576 RepID=UPI000D3A713F|nr:EfeM/EfeO family lipoprotein [Vitiosangium sp. GDMCC 1.1324]PTL75265.1 Efem/EfeO family lipoprotein [Vitiosangium sp. GDMCC 1.1324]
MYRRFLPLPFLLLSAASCGSERPPQEQALLDVKSYIQTNLDELHSAVVELQKDAPAPDADGWNATQDAAAVQKMKADWRRARIAYEHVEGAIAILFPELDVSTDQRYDGFIATGPDDDLFDDEGVTGIHAAERVLWSDSIPQRVMEFEKGLPYYQPAAFPSNENQAREFKELLLTRLVADVRMMKAQFAPLALDTSAAFRGVIGSMGEQVEKANKAASGEEESRYAQYTLADMRANVEAGISIYGYFKPWLLEQPGGKEQDARIAAGFQRVQERYASLTGDALPEVPATWSSAKPSAQDLSTPFGQLYQVLVTESDPDATGSLVSEMNTSADLLGIPRLP